MAQIASRMLSAIALPLVSTFTESQFYRLYRQYRRDPEALFSATEAATMQKVRHLLDFCYRYVPVYRERMVSQGLKPADIHSFEDLRKLQPLSKSEIGANFPDRITSERKSYQPWRYVSTSGTLERMTAVWDFRKRDYVRCSQLLALTYPSGYRSGMKYLEMPPDICRNVCGMTATVEPSVYQYLRDGLKGRRLKDADFLSDLKGLVENQVFYRRLQLPSFDGSGLAQKPETLRDLLQQIGQYGPYVFKALPAYLYELALEVKQSGISVPRIEGGIMPMGSVMTPYMKSVVEAAFHTPVREDYGCSELGGIAAECSHGGGLHVFSSMFHVEVVRDGRPAEPGEIGRVLITDLYSYAMPFIRYDIGDVGVLRRGQCECGITTDRIQIVGRLKDCLEAEDGTIVPPGMITDAILKIPGVRGFQLEARGASIQMQVVPTASGLDLAAVKEGVSSLLGSRARISTREVPTIIPERSGKFRFVKNLSPNTVTLLEKSHVRCA